ncbi:AAA domain protein [Burkholderia thailandensis E254]|uniref:AAA family ATPase n=1 Tax=Burkholderia thailandensis TaxID=57975 RepID=UPI00051551D1|nr:AAA family ATPase [Burkholderia thailandensis]AIS94011.1 AAA domain protein [Burkholderia thailandensis MSMB59]AIT19673.1 AAA domain protein [Burkholderia thailandensis E254]AOJ44840.1 DNA repair protein [Burkholderia thailandensis]KVG16647.1 DNA repair protein [Burkholderia thailandensis]MUV28880.1 AAA family ATPase [Burkholderia thailandensis]
MKITDIYVANVLGIRTADLRLAKPVALFTGPNGAGKSSLQEAVRMALTGDTVRVALKKEYGSLVTEGADGGQIVVACGEQANSVMLPSGKLKREIAEDPRLPLVLDAQRFAHLGAGERRAFLYDLMGVKIGVDEMRARLLAKLGLRADAVPAPAAARLAAITPMLRAGFEAAQKEAADRARGAKQSWRNATGETYGSQKAATWRPAPVEFDEAALRKLTGDRAALDDRIGELQQQIGAADAADTAARARASKIADLRTRAAGYAKAVELAQLADEQVAEFEPKVEALRVRAGAAPAGTECSCPECGALLRYLNGVLSAAAAAGARDADAAAKLPEYEQGLKTLQNAAANRKRDLEAADSAATQLRALEDDAADSGAAAARESGDAARSELADLQHRRKQLDTDIATLREIERRAAGAADLAKQAAALHSDVAAYEAIADALAPNGIPADLLSEALTPMNERLVALAEMSEWADVTITPEMEVLADGRAYALLSESERWRVDAHIAAAISHFSGLKLLVLDRADVLVGPERDRLLYWLDDLAYTDQIETALVFMSLKTPPGGLPEAIEAFWVEDGQVAPAAQHAIREAA